MGQPETNDPEVQQAAMRLLQQTEVAMCVPEDVRGELGALALCKKQKRPPIDQIWKDAQLKEKYGVALRQWREYVRLLNAVKFRSACGTVIKALAAMLEVPVEQGDRMLDASNMILLGKLSEVLGEQKLEPEQLVKLADALAKENTSIARTKAQRLAEQKFAHEVGKLQEPKKEFDWDADLGKVVQRVYGIDLSKSGLPLRSSGGEG